MYVEVFTMNKAETVHECQSKDKLEKPVKRNREDKQRKKDDKSVDHVLKALSSLETTEEKLGAMCQKYAEMFNDHRILQNAAKVAEKKNSILQKEKEQLQAEHSKAILTRSRLENLCRELQRQNKAVKEECMLKIREEEEKKREVAAKFQSTLTELGNLLAQNNDKNAKLRDDNLEMTNKLKNVCEQYEKKEQHVEKMAKQMHLEMQFSKIRNLPKQKWKWRWKKKRFLETINSFYWN
uniref:Alpha-taxilin isoform x1 n=1 Tax=Triatoma infestans TaxID=30076 RepID=A0A171B248_TRIIF